MRQARTQSPADIYHVIARGTGRQRIFENDEDRDRFLNILKESLTDYSAELYAWCLMGNHVHLLIHASLDKLALLMKRLCGQYAQYFNLARGRVGHLFQERYKSEPICDEAYLLTVIRYIHDNPAKAGLAETASYPWSSFNEYLHAPHICATAFPLDIFGGVEGYLAFHNLETFQAECLETDTLRNASRAMPDELAACRAADLLGGCSLNDLKTLPKNVRDPLLVKLKGAGLSIRQIERLTGIGRGIVANAREHDR